MGDQRFLVPAVAVVVALGSLIAFSSTINTRDEAVAAIITVEDPVDGWLGGEARFDGDVALAKSVMGASTRVELTGSALRFEARAASRGEAELLLTEVLSAYEQARADLRSGLDERLDMVPQLAAFVQRRTEAIEREVALLDSRLKAVPTGSTERVRAERAAAIAEALEFRDREQELLTLPGDALAPAWSSTPIDARLAALDELLSEAFWFAAGEAI